MTNTICIFIPAKDKSAEMWAQEVERELMTAGLVVETETLNASDGYLGTVPGNVFHDVTRHGVNSAVASCIFPLHSPWQGTKWNEHLKGPALLRTTRNACTPYHLNLHVGDVGHSFIAGWSGSGKSTLMNALSFGFMARYPHGQIVGIDKGRSSKVLTYLMRGMFVDVAADGGYGLQPLRHLETVADFTWAFGFVHGLAMLHDPEWSVTSEAKALLTEALVTYRDTLTPDQRTMTAFQATLQDHRLKAALAPYVRGGIYGHIMDAINGELFDNPVVMFEIGSILKQPAIAMPVADYVFHLAARRAHPDHPMLLRGDEFSHWMKPPFDAKQEETIREFRRDNVFAMFATQNIFDALDSPTGRIIVNNCPNHFLLPDRAATSPESKEALMGMGYREAAIEALSRAVPKRQYMHRQVQLDESATGDLHGTAIFDLVLEDVARIMCATTGSEWQRKADAVMARWGREHFFEGWMTENGLEVALERTGFQRMAA